MQHVRQELTETKELLKQQKMISRAKAVFANSQHISEQAAHQRMIQEAMNRRISLLDLARQIIGGNVN